MHNRVPPPIKWEQQFNNKQELIPLNTDVIIQEIYNKLLPLIKLDNTKQEFIKDVLSQYGVYKQELTPLDVEKIWEELYKYSFKDEDWYTCTSISNMQQILSKYGTTPRKKRTKEMLDDYCSSYAIYDKNTINILYQFIIDSWLT